MFVKYLKWPVISLLIGGLVHFALEAAIPPLGEFFNPTVTGPILLIFGIWVGHKTVQFGGNYLQAIISGLILSLLPVFQYLVLFGLVLGRGVAEGVPSAVFGLATVFFGSLIGSGYALHK